MRYALEFDTWAEMVMVRNMLIKMSEAAMPKEDLEVVKRNAALELELKEMWRQHDLKEASKWWGLWK